MTKVSIQSKINYPILTKVNDLRYEALFHLPKS